MVGHGEGAAGDPKWGTQISAPPKVSTSTWGLGRQEKGTGPCGDTVSCPCARRSGWQTLPVLAAVTHRCRLALLPGASASMALLALLPGASPTTALHPALDPTPRRAEGEDARWRMYLYPVTRAE